MSSPNTPDDPAQVQAGLDIERRSFEIIDAEAPRSACPHFDDDAWSVVRRVIHAGGDLSLAGDFVLHNGHVNQAVTAIRNAATVYTDSRMAVAGISISKLRQANGHYSDHFVSCLLDRPGIMETSKKQGITRSAAGMRLLETHLPGSIVVIGNAPTALETLLDMIAEGLAPPAFIVGLPVGFVGAAESKSRLIDASPCPFLTLRGRRGGSNLAAAAMNALAVLAASHETS